MTDLEKARILRDKRLKIAFDYCLKKGWPTDPVELSFEQILEIRALDEWINVEIESNHPQP